MLAAAARGKTTTRAALGAAITLIAVPATAAAQDPLPTLPAVPSAPTITLPLSVPAAQPCPGAHRRRPARLHLEPLARPRRHPPRPRHDAPSLLRPPARRRPLARAPRPRRR